MKQSPLILISPLVIFDSRHLHATTYLKHFYCFYYSLHHTKLRFCYLFLWRILDNFFLLTNYLIQGIANKVSFLKSFWLFFQEFYAPMYQIVRLNCYDLSFLSFLPFIEFQKRNLRTFFALTFFFCVIYPQCYQCWTLTKLSSFYSMIYESQPGVSERINVFF